jgi:glucose-6-phosphate dehydrogenase assembly protein OpcA
VATTVILDLTETTASKINSALINARRSAGSPAMGMVLTLVVVTDEASHYDALKAATDAAREHPSRILAVVRRPGRGEPRLDAEIRVGGESGPGEVLLLRLHGALADHAASVALPLLLPDAPVVTWWPGVAPDNPCQDPLGALAQRRVTDAAGCPSPSEELRKRAAGYSPGDTDLSWTRLTSWRTQLAAALDDPFPDVESATISAEADSPSAELLAGWLGQRLGVPVGRVDTDGPGITGVRLHSTAGDIAIDRPDGRLAVLSRPGWPDRPVALQRRRTAELIAEELRRLDPDEVYGETLAEVGSASSSVNGTGQQTPSTRAAAAEPSAAEDAQANPPSTTESSS